LKYSKEVFEHVLLPSFLGWVHIILLSYRYESMSQISLYTVMITTMITMMNMDTIISKIYL